MFLLSNSQAISESFGKQLHIIAFNMLEQLDMIEKVFDFICFPARHTCVQDDGHAFSNEWGFIGKNW